MGVDAAVKTQATRCVAGGYVWNPFYTQLADPLNVSLYVTYLIFFELSLLVLLRERLD